MDFIKELQTKMPANNKQKKSGKGGKNAGGNKAATKVAASKSSSSSCLFKCMFGSFLLFGAITGLIAYDTHRNDGKFEESTLGRVLDQAGALPHVENAWKISMKYSARGYKLAEEHVPVYFGKTKTFLTPYVLFAKDLTLVAFNMAKRGLENMKVFIVKQSPVAAAYIDKYVPGLGEKIHNALCTTCTTISSVSSNVYKQSVEFFKTKVFVGNLSPENLGKALNSTQNCALGYYSWFNKKVDFYAKIK